MNKNLVIAVVVGIVVVLGFLGVNQSKQAADMKVSQQAIQNEKAATLAAAQEVEAKAKAAAQEAEAQAKAAAQEVEAKAKAIAQEAEAQAKAAAQEVAAQAEALKNSLVDLIAKAKALLESGDYQGAIAAAQNILTQDPSNTDAKSILEQAQDALKKLAADQMKNVEGGVKNVLGTIGK